MSSIFNFVQSEHFLALFITILIFLTAILLTIKRWVGFPTTLLLLVFASIAGLIINYKRNLEHDFTFFSSKPVENKSSKEDFFHQHLLQAMEDLKVEVETEKQNLHRVIHQVQEVFDSMDIQKQKLEDFIDEAREQFKRGYPTKSSSISESSFNNYEDLF